MTDLAQQTAPKSLRVVHVTFGLDMGGLERLLLQIAEQTDPKQVQLFFVSLGSTGLIGSEIRNLGWPAVSLHRPEGLRPSLLFSLARLFHGVRADAVHTHDARALIYGAPAARLVRVKQVVHTQHGQNLGMTPRRLKLLRFAANRTSKYVCVSKDAMRIASEHGIPASRLHMIHNGIDVDRLQHESLELPAKDQPGPLVTVARLSPEKDISTLLQAVAIVKKKLPDFQLEIAGDGPCRADLEQEVEQLGLGQQVRFLGQVPGAAGVLHRARMFVLPSISEGLSLTLLEAMSVGVPTIATDVGGNPEVVEHGRTGLLVPPRDPEAMAAAICKLWTDEPQRQQLASTARQWVHDKFHVRQMINQYEQLYSGSQSPRTLPDSSTDADTPATLVT